MISYLWSHVKRLNKFDTLSIVVYMLISSLLFLSTYIVPNEGYFIGTDARLPYYPINELSKIFNIYNNRIGFGFPDTGWSILSKGLPIYVFTTIFSNQEIGIRLYFVLLILSCMVYMHIFLVRISYNRNIFITLFAIFWGMQKQILLYLTASPNIIAVYCGIPLTAAALYGFARKHNQFKTNFALLIFGFNLIISGDMSYFIISTIILSVFFVCLWLGDNNKIKVFKNILPVPLILIAIGAIYVSGLILVDQTEMKKNYFDNSYTNSAIKALPFTADIYSTLQLDSGQKELDHSKFDYFAVEIVTLVVIFGFIFFYKTRNQLALISLILILLGLILSAGSNIPNHELFYKFIYSIPELKIVRNMFKFNLLFIFGYFLLSYLLTTHITKYKSILLQIILFCLLVIPFANTISGFFKSDIYNKLNFVKIPKEYSDLKNTLESGSNYRIFYYPLKDPVTTENYKWLTSYETSKSIISEYIDTSDNLDVSISHHKFNLGLLDILRDPNRKDANTEFLQSLGSASYKYIIIRTDLAEKYLTKQNYIDIDSFNKSFFKANLKPVFIDKYFTVYKIPDEYFIPIFENKSGKVLEYDRNFSYFVLDNSYTNQKSTVNINTVKTNYLKAFQPRIQSFWGIKLAKLDPLIFGKKLKTDNIDCTYLKGPLQVYNIKLGNCLQYTSNSNIIIVDNYLQVINRDIKIIAIFVLFAIIFFIINYKSLGFTNKIVNLSIVKLNLLILYYAIKLNSKWALNNHIEKIDFPLKPTIKKPLFVSMFFAFFIKKIKSMSKKFLYIFIGSILIFLWQVYLIPFTSIDQKYGRHDGSGLIYNQASTFVYFHYYLNLYPVRTTYDDKTYSKEGAEYVLNNKKDLIYNDNSYYITWGEHGKEWVLYLSTLITGNPQKPTVVPLTSGIFTFSLVILFMMFSLYNQKLLAAITVLLLGSNPFQLYEIYKTENIFSLGISFLIILLAINTPLIFRDKTKLWILLTNSVISGVLLGVLSHIRMEYLVITSSVLIIITFSQIEIYKKALLTISFLCFIVGTSFLLGLYFNYKVTEAVNFVSKLNNNHDLDITSRRNYHTIWHPILIGLGDFDKKYGYKWDDQMAYKLARPILKERYPDRYQKMEPGEFMSVQPEYHNIIKQEILNRIESDPVWYIKILVKRSIKIVTNATPISVNLNYISFNIHLIPIILLPFLIYLLLDKNWPYVTLILASIPMSLSILLIHSLNGITNLTIFHYFIVAILLTTAIKKL